MKKMIGSFAAAALLLALTLPGPAGAADNKRTDGLTNANPQITDISAHRRRARAYVRYGYRYRYYPRYRYYRYYGDYAYAPYPYRYYGPRYYRPGVSFHFGF